MAKMVINMVGIKHSIAKIVFGGKITTNLRPSMKIEYPINGLLLPAKIGRYVGKLARDRIIALATIHLFCLWMT